MTIVAMLFGLMMVGLGVTAMASPRTMLHFAERFQTQAGLYAAMAIRLAMGTVLILVAPNSRVPQALRILGAIVFVSGMITPFIGVERVKRIIAWWTTRPAFFQRAWAAMALTLGAFVVWAVAM